ncbi:ABC transporter [Metarhizium guizhouense ARSEF 977]|uniref:ABC transporter n=1 Tax=Metarhizium guizhouense (strain ARSEF 977) TaxID=1276136 RepID=A0A0B4GP69_METGA|nr:ABC transporter [Metarhizium guizhouense ARSEF 977]
MLARHCLHACIHAVRHLQWADHVIALAAEGTVAQQGTFDELVANQQYIYSLGVHDNQSSGSTCTRGKPLTSPTTAQASTVVVPVAPAEVDEAEQPDSPRSMGDMAVFAHYFKSVGAFWVFAFLLLGWICGFLTNFSTVWLEFWSADATSANPNRATPFYVGIYSLLQCLGIASVVGVNGIGMLIIIKLSGARLHKAAIRTVGSAPLRFFTSTDTGVMTNYFSQDMTLIDNELPLALVNTNVMVWIVIGSAAVAATSSAYVLISYPSRLLLVLSTTNFIDTIKGVVTLRAFEWTEDARAKNDTILNTSQRPSFLLRMVQRWLTLVLGMVVAALAILVVVLATQLRTQSGFAGASMVSIMTFGKFIAAIIQNYTLLETSMGAVTRLKTFSESTPVEDPPGEHTAPPSSWPDRGVIEIRDVSASHAGVETKEGDGNLALRGLTMKIEAGRKVAFGKSSITLLLLGLLDPIPSSKYTLSIDGLPLDTLDRAALRDRLISVPQDPVFFPDGTSFKGNLDSTDTATDADCQAALEKGGLWDFVLEQGGLTAGLTADSLKLTRDVGKSYLQAQCAEASEAEIDTISATQPPVKKGGVLILDEFSSSLDVDTDKLMQEVVLHEFDGYTVIMVSHRLEITMRFDQVVVLDRGSVVEQGVPTVLAQQKRSYFRD